MKFLFMQVQNGQISVISQDSLYHCTSSSAFNLKLLQQPPVSYTSISIPTALSEGCNLLILLKYSTLRTYFLSKQSKQFLLFIDHLTICPKTYLCSLLPLLIFRFPLFQLNWYKYHLSQIFEQAPGVGDGQGSLACCSPWGGKESDTTEQLN